MRDGAGGKPVEVERVETNTAADVDDRVGEAVLEFDVCNLCDRRGVDGSSTVSVRESRVREGGNTGGFPGLGGWAGVGPVSAVRYAAVLLSSPGTDDFVSPSLKGDKADLVGDSILRLFVGVSGKSAWSNEDSENATVRFCDVALDIISSRSLSLPFIADLMGDFDFCGERPGN